MSINVRISISVVIICCLVAMSNGFCCIVFLGYQPAEHDIAGVHTFAPPTFAAMDDADAWRARQVLEIESLSAIYAEEC